MGKRGISPLIATVILIAFAVSLGAVVMNLGPNINGVPENQETECAGILIQFQQVSGKSITLGGSGSEGFMEFVVVNAGTKTASSLRASIISDRDGSAQTKVVDIPQSEAKPAFPISKRIAYDYNLFGQPKQLQLIPIVKIRDQTIPCIASSASQSIS